MRILIIEDEEKLARSLQMGLEREGYAVDYVLDGYVGQRRIEVNSTDYDLIILDVMLPGKNGIDVCRNWRKKGITIPVLMLTAKDTKTDILGGLNSGADDYLVKPFDMEILLARLRTLLRRPKQSLPVQFKIKDLVLDTVTKKVHFRQTEILLTRKEFSLLEYFIRHPNQVLSREQIINHAWNFDFESFTNVVDVHVKNLRSKLKKAGYAHALETVRGLGYRLHA